MVSRRRRGGEAPPGTPTDRGPDAALILAALPDAVLVIDRGGYIRFINPAAEQFLGSAVVTTDADGNASFTVTLAVAIDPGWLLTATATDAANNTSRFSDPVQLTE